MNELQKILSGKVTLNVLIVLGKEAHTLLFILNDEPNRKIFIINSHDCHICAIKTVNKGHYDFHDSNQT